MKAVVFGGSGFVGSHVADRLSEAGHEVTIFDVRESTYLRDDQHMIVGSILDDSAVRGAVGGNDWVLNFAGMMDLDECQQKPVQAVELNVLGNLRILDASAKSKVKRFVFASSAYVFSKVGAIYSNTKQASELFIDTYSRLHGLEYTIVRYGSLYGTRCDMRNSLYRIIHDAITAGRIEYHGDGTERRDYIHVRDAADLTLRIFTGEFVNKHVLLTGRDTLAYADLLNMISEMMDHQVTIAYTSNKRKAHYKLTPYSFSPQIGTKLVNNPYVDMGQGLLEIMHEVHDAIRHEKEN
ncbi:MAG: NAD-dependent epimerase/dehydratase family protein [Chitinivibrionales bacterium]|nr:NAD-dependent epimerase/dehydratase family protein [Chitinivibrionales bacterium]MBD3394867.1 NAD-dependent epimerase/dehydratase family protein [Chitinivibrionales bacterium]